MLKSSFSCFKFYQPRWFMPKKVYQDEELLQAYKVMITNIMLMFNSTHRNLLTDVEKMVQLESKLALVSKTQKIVNLNKYLHDFMFERRP